MIVQLDRSYYSLHRQIYDWVHANTKSSWNNGYSMMFGYQEIELTEDEHEKFIAWLRTLRPLV